MRASRLAVSMIAIALTIGGAAAQEDADEKSWTNKTELGFVSTTGNSETTNLTFANKYTHTWTKAEFVFDAFALRTENTERFLSNPDGTVDVSEETKLTAEQYLVAGKYTRQIHERLGWYGSLRWTRNQFAGIQNRSIVGACPVSSRITDRLPGIAACMMSTVLAGNSLSCRPQTIRVGG